MLVAFGKVFGRQVMQFDDSLYEKPQKTAVVYFNGWRKHLRELCDFINSSLVAPFSIVRAVSDTCPTTEAKA